MTKQTIWGCVGCGYRQTVRPAKPRVTRCPECRRFVLSRIKAEPAAEREHVFTNCNVCGIALRTDDEDRMGMCERCAKE